MIIFLYASTIVDTDTPLYLQDSVLKIVLVLDRVQRINRNKKKSRSPQSGEILLKAEKLRRSTEIASDVCVLE